jgi:hypothetical protein
LKPQTLGPAYETGLTFFGIEWGLEMAVHCLFVVKYWVASQKASLSLDTLKGGKLGLY